MELNWHLSIFQIGTSIWISPFIVTVGEDLFQARKYVCSKVEGPARFCSLQVTWAVFETYSHSCLISLSWRQEYTTITRVEQVSKTVAHAVCTWGGVPLSWVTKSCGSFGPKADNTLGWALPSKSTFLWGRICSKLAICPL